MAERLHFNTDMSYESMLAAEHLTRYWLLRSACKGMRVLDVACGEGYGSSLLRSWGAQEVVGVDLSAEAIRNARMRFGTSRLSYRIGDACDLDTVLGDDECFDLVACFETMEHVPDVPGLLRGIQAHLAPGGSIVVSCPNDVAVLNGHPNEFHLRTYTFEEFQAVTTDILGPAAQWQLGVPVLGYGICHSGDEWMHGLGSQLINMLKGADSTEARFLPAQAGHEVGPQTASFYMGVWGGQLPRTTVVAPISHEAYHSPWNNWMAARQENDELIAARSALEVSHAAAIKHQSDVFAIEREHAKQDKQTLKDEFWSLQRQMASERSARLQMAARLYEREQQQHQIRNAEHERYRIDIECERRARAVSDAERDRVILERDELSARLNSLYSSRAYRLIQQYYLLYENNATRWFMRPLRRVARRFRRVVGG